MTIYSSIKRFIKACRQCIQIYKAGGVVKSNISFCDQSNLLKDKNIIITGGSSGIGLSMARKFINSGANVIITGRSKEKLEEAISTINNPKCKSLIWDQSDIEVLAKNIDKAKSLFNGEIDILINNAGIAPSKFWGEVDEREWDSIYNINLKGIYFLTQEIVRQWKESTYEGYKKILNISSQGGFVGATYPYRMAKWDLRGLTEGLGKSLIKDRIIVNGIAPGVVQTGMQKFSLEQGDNLYTDQNPINRVCLPEEIAELAAFLISDTCNFIIGHTIVCDGGYILK